MTKVVLELERLRYLECGLGQYSLHLGRAILDQASDGIEPVFLLPPGGEAHFAPRRVAVIQSLAWRRDGVAQWFRPFVGCWPRRSDIDVWHVSHQDSKFWPLDPRVPVVLTVHDLNFLREKPPHVIRRRLARLSDKVARATVVTTASHYAAREVAEYIPMRGKQIRVIPHGVCLDHDTPPQRPAMVDPVTPFLFAIADITPKKNFHVLVALLDRLPGYNLVVAGSKSHDYAARIEQEAAQRGLSRRVVLPGRVTEGERNWLYAHCAAFVFPSLAEGFGLPLIEAMSHGRPVFAARCTSLPEVGGPLAFYWDELDAESMEAVFREGMSRFAAEPGYEDKLRGWSDRFRWPDAARKYLELYREVAEGRQRAAA